MNQTNNILVKIPEGEFPSTLHGAIMNRIKLFRLRRWLQFGIVILCINAVITSLNMINYMVENDAQSIIQFLAQGFKLNIFYFQYSIDALREVMPVPSLELFLFNLLLGIIVVRFLHSIHKQSYKGREVSVPI